MTQPQQPNPDQDDTRLAPIPSDGTSAPSDSERVFGKQKGAESAPGGGDSRQPEDSHRPGRSGRPDQPGQSREPLGEEEQRALRNRGRMAIILGFGGLFIGVMFIPSGALIGLPLGLAGGVMGLGAFRRGRKAGTTVPGAVPAIVIGVLALALTAVIGLVSVMFAGELQRAADCLSGANTRIAQQSCMEQLDQDMKERGYDLNLTEVPGTSGAASLLPEPSSWSRG